MATDKVRTSLVSIACKAHKGTSAIVTVSGGMHHLVNFGACEFIEAALLAAGVSPERIAEARAEYRPGAAKLSADDKAAATLARIRASRATSAPVAAMAAEPVEVKFRSNGDGTFSPVQ